MKKLLITSIFLLGLFVVSAQEGASSTQKAVKQLNKEEFLRYVYNFEKNPQKWVAEGKLPFIVDFYEDWCGPCRMIAPILEELAQEYKGKIHIYKVNTQYEPEIKRFFRINRFPTLFFCAEGKDPQLVLGAQSKENFKMLIETVLLKK